MRQERTVQASLESLGQLLPSRAGVVIVLSVVNEVMAGEQAALVGPHGFWNARRNAGSLARQHLLAVEVAAIRQSCEFFAPIASCALRAIGSSWAVVADIDHFVGHDQMMFGIDRGLNIVADDACPASLVAIERASGSVREICWSGASCTFSLIACKACI